MYTPEEMEGDPDVVVIRLRKKYRSYWREKSDWYWFKRLMQEVWELFGCIAGFHKDPMKWELLQIAAICVNWIYKNEKEM